MNPLRALRDYKDLPGAFGPGKLVTAAFARAPYAMLPLGILTAFTATTGDVAIGGAVTAVFSIAVAICSPLIGRAADRFGQRSVLLVTIPAQALALLGLYWAALTAPDPAVIYPLALLAGMSSSPVGSFTRARWVGMRPTPRLLTAAFSYESMMDESVFVLGPALVGIAATAAAPSAPLLVSLIVLLVAGIPFALTAPGRTQADSAGEPTHPAMLRVIVSIIPSMIVLVAMGTFFGSTQAATTARAEELGTPGMAGLIYAAMGISSALMSLLVVALPKSFPLALRFITFSICGGLLTVGAAFAGSLSATAIWYLMVGLFIGPTLVTGFTLAEKLAPPGGISVAMTLMASSLTVGVSIGSALGGQIAQTGGSRLTLSFSASVMVVIAAVGIVTGSKKSGQKPAEGTEGTL